MRNAVLFTILLSAFPMQAQTTLQNGAVVLLKSPTGKFLSAEAFHQVGLSSQTGLRQQWEIRVTPPFIMEIISADGFNLVMFGSGQFLHVPIGNDPACVIMPVVQTTAFVAGQVGNLAGGQGGQTYLVESGDSLAATMTSPRQGSWTVLLVPNPDRTRKPKQDAIVSQQQFYLKSSHHRYLNTEPIAAATADWPLSQSTVPGRWFLQHTVQTGLRLAGNPYALFVTGWNRYAMTGAGAVTRTSNVVPMRWVFEDATGTMTANDRLYVGATVYIRDEVSGTYLSAIDDGKRVILVPHKNVWEQWTIERLP